MEAGNDYSPAERTWLAGLAVFGFTVLNGAFVWGLIFEPGSLMAALANPIACAMIVETMIMMGLLAYLLPRWGVTRMAWGWFVALSLLGGMLFALPCALMWRSRRSSS